MQGGGLSARLRMLRSHARALQTQVYIISRGRLTSGRRPATMLRRWEVIYPAVFFSDSYAINPPFSPSVLVRGAVFKPTTPSFGFFESKAFCGTYPEYGRFLLV